MPALAQWGMAPLHVVLITLVVAAVIDVCIEWIPDTFTGVAGVGLVVASFHAGVTWDEYLNGALSAAVIFLAYLELGVRGIIGGGDVKLSVLPAAVLGAVSPMLALWWFVTTIALQGLLSLAGRTSRSPAGIPHVPAMALTFVAASSFAVCF